MDIGSRYVDVPTSLGYAGTVLKYLAVAPLAPAVVAVYYGESVVPFLLTTGVMAGLGLTLEYLRVEEEMGRRETFLMVSLSWLLVPVLGTIPYLVAGQGTVADPVNATFESMSGFTTTGSTVLGEISFERHSRSMLIWRQLTQWLGGMGILVLMVAILPQLAINGAQIISEESPGLTIDKLTPKIQETARALWLIYAGFTVAAAASYYALHLLGVAPNMDLYNAVSHALTTLPTGGFSPEARSIEAFSGEIQWTVIFFMVVGGTNFALFWYVKTGEYRKPIENEEFRGYVLALFVASALLATLLYSGRGLAEIPDFVGPIAGNAERALRQATFQAVAIVTTTGYASMDFNTWSEPTQAVLLLAFFLGGSAGSAAGSIKIVRWQLAARTANRELYTTVHPEAVRPVRYMDEPVEENSLRGVLVFVMLFLGLFAVSTILIYLDALRTGLDMTTIEAMSVAIATLGNIGPGFGIVGPMNSFLPFSDPAKLYMVFLMWIGRLEVVTVVVILTPSFWRR